jgi:hypothetical protein
MLQGYQTPRKYSTIIPCAPEIPNIKVGCPVRPCAPGIPSTQGTIGATGLLYYTTSMLTFKGYCQVVQMIFLIFLKKKFFLLTKNSSRKFEIFH